MTRVGVKDTQTVTLTGSRVGAANIDGVRINELGNVITRSGFMTEIFRIDWPAIGITVRQINQVQLNPGAVTDWHAHAKQTDHLIGVGGNIKLALWDGRDDSPTRGATGIMRLGIFRPVMVIVPRGVWHGLRNESGEPAGYINVIDELYEHADPDNWRLAPHSKDIPDILQRPDARVMCLFGEAFKLTLVTDDPVLAKRADNAGVDRIGLDLECLGKAERQAGLDTRISGHRIGDLPAIDAAISNAALFARLNPLHDGTRDEIATALSFGAKVLMLPFFSTAREVEVFATAVDRRAHVVILVETAQALTRMRDILAVEGIDEVMAGLNDLHLDLGVRNPFELLVSPLIDVLAAETRRAGLMFSVGGVSSPHDGALPIPPDLVLAQYPRLHATGAWLSRSFLRHLSSDRDFSTAVASIRQRLTEWAAMPASELERARDQLAALGGGFGPR